MTKTNKERVLEFIRNASPQAVTNAQIRAGTGVKSHQQVYMLTQELARKRLIQAKQQGREWVFWVETSTKKPPIIRPDVAKNTSPSHVKNENGTLSPYAFEDLARSAMSVHFGVPLVVGKVPGVPKEFDMVSADSNIVGDAKYYTLVRGKRLPPAKFSVIAEHIWLLEKTEAEHRFLIFGNQREVPEIWLERYGDLVVDIDFYFLTDDGNLELLTGKNE